MKLISTVFIILISTIAYSQIENGKKSIGGIFNIYNYNQEIGTVTNGTSQINKIKSEFNFNINPYFEFVVSEKIAIGFAPGYNYTKTIEYSTLNNVFDNTIKQNLIYITPFIKTYRKIGERLYFYANLAITIGKGTYKQMKLNSTYNGIVEDDPMSIFRIIPNAGVGMQYFLNDKFAINFQWTAIQYYYETIKQSTSTINNDTDYTLTTKEFSINLDMSSLYLGLSYYF
jgi:hypothetical protein